MDRRRRGHGVPDGQLRWAWMGSSMLAARPEGLGRAHGLGPIREDRFFFFFSNLFLMQKQFQKNLEIVQRHEKYSENHNNSRKISRDRLRHEQSN
jgi:hypothetical protein